MEIVLFAVFVSWVIFAVFGCWIAGQKNRSFGEGFFLGMFFGPLGCLIEAILPSVTKEDMSISSAEAARIAQAYQQQINDQYQRERALEAKRLIDLDAARRATRLARDAARRARAARWNQFKNDHKELMEIVRYATYGVVFSVPACVVIAIVISIAL